MDTKTYLLILLAAIAALAIAVFQYFYKSNKRSKTLIVLTLLRFLSIFLLLLLLINPSIESNQLETQKPRLIVAIDNSSSVKLLNNDNEVRGVIEAVSNDNDLKSRFDIDFFAFNENVNRLDSLDFSVNKTNIINALQSLDNLYESSDALVLITDGNQTLGSDYSFYKAKPRAYPVVLGDTVPHVDLKIGKLNVNKYSFLNNTFPIEVFVNYNGNDPITTNLTITNGSNTVLRKTIALDATKNSERVTFNTTAARVGVLNYNVQLSPLTDEINKVNNRTNFTVEVIDEQSKIALISDIIHPDLGMLKRSIETNKQRKVEILNLNEIDNLNDYQLIILYQPTIGFKTIFDKVKESNLNYFVITGPKTNWSFLNRAQDDFIKSTINQTEETQAARNTSYGSFVVDDFDFENLPPLEAKFGTLEFKLPSETILYQRINNIETEKPLLATFTKNNRRGAILMGEGIWKWRTFSYSNTKSFIEFDQFINKLIQYLSIKKRLNRLDLDYLPVVYQNDIVTIKATYFDNNYNVDSRANLNLTLRNNDNNEVKVFPFRLSGQNFISSISDLESGNYTFTVKVEGQAINRRGYFTVLDYNIEQQFTYANLGSLKKLADNSNGKLYHVSSFNELAQGLKNDDLYRPIQKSNIKKMALIDWKWLLALIALFLSLEWFIRKYYGKI